MTSVTHAIFGDCNHPRRKNTKAIAGETACILGRRADGPLANLCCECTHFDRSGVVEINRRSARRMTEIVSRSELKRGADGRPYWDVATGCAGTPVAQAPGEPLTMKADGLREGTVVLIMEPIR